MENRTSDESITKPPEFERGPPNNQAEQAFVPEDHPSGWFRQAVTLIADAWFEPKSFEQYPGLYENLGVKEFKKYMPISGDLIYRLVWKKFGELDMVKPHSLESLKTMENFTRFYEATHLAGFAVMSAEMGATFAHHDISGTLFLGLLNALANIYPIMVQRYNRIRLFKTIKRMET